jgi:hypothetical protein
MSELEIILRLIAVVLLASYLRARHRRRILGRPLPPEDPCIWTGQGLDTSVLTPELNRIRRNYAGLAHSRRRRPDFRAQLLAAIGHSITAREYFRNKRLGV